MHVAISTKYMPGVSSQFCILILEYLKKGGGGILFIDLKLNLSEKTFFVSTQKYFIKYFIF